MLSHAPALCIQLLPVVCGPAQPLTQGGIWKVNRHFCPACSSGMSGVASVSQRPPHRLQQAGGSTGVGWRRHTGRCGNLANLANLPPCLTCTKWCSAPARGRRHRRPLHQSPGRAPACPPPHRHPLHSRRVRAMRSGGQASCKACASNPEFQCDPATSPHAGHAACLLTTPPSVPSAHTRTQQLPATLGKRDGAGVALGRRAVGVVAACKQRTGRSGRLSQDAAEPTTASRSRGRPGRQAGGLVCCLDSHTKPWTTRSHLLGQSARRAGEQRAGAAAQSAHPLGTEQTHMLMRPAAAARSWWVHASSHAPQPPLRQAVSSPTSRPGGGQPRLMSTSSLFMPASLQALGMVTSTLSGALPVMGAPANTGTVSAGAAGRGRGRQGAGRTRQCALAAPQLRWALGGWPTAPLSPGKPPAFAPGCRPP